MINRFAFAAVLMVGATLLAGCYTQLGYDTTSRIAPRGMNKINEADTLNEREEAADDQAGVERQTEVEEDGGYYSRRARAYDRYIPYYDGYYSSDPYPYYGYYSPYYSYYPYYRNYGYWRPYSYGRKHRSDYAPRYYKNRDFHHGKRRSRNHRGVNSRRSVSDRPIRKADSESDQTTPKENNSRRRESRSYKRRR